jgi:hypothetical protein
LSGGDGDRAEVVADQVVVTIRIVPGIDLGVVVDLIGLVQGLVVDEDLLVPDLDLLAFERDDPLDEILVHLFGIFKDDDVLPLDPLMREKGSLEREDRVRVGQLIDEEEIADEERRLHGPGGDLKGLDDEGHHKEDEDSRLGDQLEVFPDDALVALPLLFSRHEFTFEALL